ncbi:MAG TPA: TonB-dependent receptor [Candidatus Cloacimonetes bacterium]|nr:TonB-dependent receptor [Candidatus Cloacimonadota bacterium]HEX38032.1 TonB-dependent receptor [Candidatus Cloacimonadota bacterium]
MKKVLTVLMVSLFLVTTFAYAQVTGNIAGKITAEKTGDPISDANVYLEGTEYGMLSRNDGTFLIKGIPSGTYTVAVSYLGYAIAREKVEIKPGLTTTVNFALEIKDIGISGIKVFADRAEETTPIAYTDVNSEAIAMDLGSRDLPLVLKSTPSVYSTDQGGGAGDARVNIRGFNQRNIAIMINGVPVNDMENGWVYWSNWDGLSDATSSIQVQRGLSAVNLAVPSIGGTMNIITDPTQMTAGATFKQEFGAGNYRKTTLIGNTGLVDDKYALSFALVRKLGDGVADRTWTDAYAYYVASSYNLNDKNRLEFYAVGAPQRHGQRLYAQNIATFNHEFAKDLSGYDPAALADFLEKGYNFNQNWSPVNSGYQGEQWWDDQYRMRHDDTFIMERENFYHKPQINLNWFSQLSEKLNFYSTFYYSGGKGGGTGTFGEVYRRDANGKLGDDDWKFYYGPSPWTWDWDATIAMNQGPAGSYWVDKDSLYKETGQALGILRNSVNRQWTVGAIVKAEYEINSAIKTLVGLDWRTAEINHFREVRDLLGGNWYYWDGDEFDTGNHHKKLGDKIDYYNTNTVDWMGGFVQGEYKQGKLTASISVGPSAVKYTYLDHFQRDPADTTKALKTVADWITGYQAKGGVHYVVMPDLGIFANAGYVSKVPILDEVINDWTGELYGDPINEKYLSAEVGFSWVGLDGLMNIKADGYFTDRKDETKILETDDPISFDEVRVKVSGIDSRFMGVELETVYQPFDFLGFQLNASKGIWKYTDDVTAVVKYPSQDSTMTVYIKDLKVGNQPQTQVSLAANLTPFAGLETRIVGKYYMDFWSNWNVMDRDDPNDRTQSWKVPNFGTVDFHLKYHVPTIVRGLTLKIFAHAFNVLDEIYIQDATDNSAYNAYDKDHDADDAEVFFGPRRKISVGVEVGL